MYQPVALTTSGFSALQSWPSGEPAGGLFLVTTALLRDLLPGTDPYSRLLATIPPVDPDPFREEPCVGFGLENYVM